MASTPSSGRVRLLGRPDCHLCDDARDVLERMGITPVEVDIEADDDLLRAHLERIPVIEVDGAEVCHFFVDEDAVRAALSSGRP